jgi:hypothetical protein
MIVNAKFIYDAKILLKRHRNRADVRLIDSADVKIQEATGEQAPVALLVPSDRRIWHAEGEEPEPKAPYRLFAGSLWSPRVDSHVPRGEKPKPITAEDLRAMAEKGDQYRNPFHTGVDWHWRDAKRLSDIDNVKEADLSARDAVVRHLEAVAAGLVLVDGILYERTDEPVYVVKRSGTFSAHTWVSLEITGYDAAVAEKSSLENMYRVDRLDEAVARMKELGWKEEDGGLDQQDIVEVLLPECLGADDETPVMLESVSRTLTTLADRVSRMRKDKMGLYADLRDASSGATEVTPEIIAAARAIVDGFRNAADDEGDSWALDKLAEALERWDLRPVSAPGDAQTISL